MGEIFDLDESRRNKFLNRSHAEIIADANIDVLAHVVMTHEALLQQGLNEEEARRMSGDLYAEYQAATPEKKEKVHRRVEDIRVEEAEQERLIREHINPIRSIEDE